MMKKTFEIEMENEETSKELVSNKFEQVKKSNLPLSKATTMAMRYLRDISANPEDDDEEARESLNGLIQRIYSQEDQIGEVDDFHNFAVSLASKDEYGLACIILECGLKYFPRNVDLLADFLEYGKYCNRRKDSIRYCGDLNKIPRQKWTWRGFAFSMNYLLDLIECGTETEGTEDELIGLATDFKKYFPYSEESYRSLASMYQKFNQVENELEVLKEAMINLEVCPRCALKCADILFDRGKYDESFEAIQRGISDANQTQTTVSEGYIYYLSALCSIAISQKNKTPLDESSILDIYSCFNIALREFGYSSTYNDVIATKTNTLLVKYGIEIPAEYDRLRESMLDF